MKSEQEIKIMIFELRQFDKTLLKFEYIEESLTRKQFSFTYWT